MAIISVLFLGLVSLLGHPPAQTNEFSGQWVGYLTQEKGGYREKYYCTLNLVQKGNQVTGTSYVSVDEIHAEMALQGTISGKQLQYQETKMLRYTRLEDMVWCIKGAQLTLKKSDTTWILEGTWSGRSVYGPCIPGKVYLKKITPRA